MLLIFRTVLMRYTVSRSYQRIIKSHKNFSNMVPRFLINITNSGGDCGKVTQKNHGLECSNIFCSRYRVLASDLKTIRMIVKMVLRKQYTRNMRSSLLRI